MNVLKLFVIQHDGHLKRLLENGWGTEAAQSGELKINEVAYLPRFKG